MKSVKLVREARRSHVVVTILRGTPQRRMILAWLRKQHQLGVSALNRIVCGSSALLCDARDACDIVAWLSNNTRASAVLRSNRDSGSVPVAAS